MGPRRTRRSGLRVLVQTLEGGGVGEWWWRFFFFFFFFIRIFIGIFINL